MNGDDDEVKGYGIRGMNILRRGQGTDGKPRVHLIESVCKSRRLMVRSSYSGETLAAAHGIEDAYPTIVTLHELNHGVFTPAQLKEVLEKGGRIRLDVTLTVDAESVYKSLTSKDLHTPTEKTLLGHVSWLRQILQLGIVDKICWCDTRDMTADGHTKGSIPRDQLLQLMDGHQKYNYEIKVHKPFRATNDKL